MNWLDQPPWNQLPAEALKALAQLRPLNLQKGDIVFQPGQTAKGFAVVLSGQIDVYLIGPTGRDILLYSVTPGQSCVQTTLGLLGGEPYSGEGLAARHSQIVLIPSTLFTNLMDSTPMFRTLVFQAFAERMQNTMHVLEKVAFQRVEARLAEALLSMADQGEVRATQAEIASHIGSAREVISRRLDSFARRGWVTTERGHVVIRDADALKRLVSFAGET